MVRPILFIPRSKADALRFVCDAAAWIKIEFHSEDCRRNSGWGKHYTERWAYEILMAAADRIRNG